MKAIKAYELIDRIARLDEQAPVEEPITEPDVLPEEPIVPERQPARRTGSPYEIPPDFDPGHMPAPKAEDDTDAISNWLEATQQPIQDWEWDGHELRMLMDDGTTEVYSRKQLEDVGIFGNEMSFAESEEPEVFDVEEEEVTEPSDEMPDEEPEPMEEPEDGNESTGTLDMILGRAPCAEPASAGELDQAQVIHVDGEQAEEISAAVGDLVKAILGVGSDDSGESETDNSSDKEPDNKDGKKPSKSKKSKKKDADKDGDKDEDKDGDKKDDEDE